MLESRPTDYLFRSSSGRAIHTADAFASCFAAVHPGLLSGRSQQCCSPVCSPGTGEADARSRRASPTRLTDSGGRPASVATSMWQMPRDATCVNRPRTLSEYPLLDNVPEPRRTFWSRLSSCTSIPHAWANRPHPCAIDIQHKLRH
jgi:hypothetical protein